VDRRPATDSAADKAAAEFEYARSVEWFMDPIFKGSYPALALKVHGDNAPVVQPGDLESRTRRSTSSA
jgi:beta-glucosidase